MGVRASRCVALVTVCASVALVAGCGSLSVSDIQKQINRGLNDQLARQGAGLGASVNADVSCPKNSSVKAGSVFYCEAQITSTPLPGAAGSVPGAPATPGAPGAGAGASSSSTEPKTETRRVKVTVQSSSKASWQVQ